VRTVEGHLYRLFTKLGINNRDQLIHLTSRHLLGNNTLSMRLDDAASKEPPDRHAAG
jgi:hypothetical protein